MARAKHHKKNQSDSKWRKRQNKRKFSLQWLNGKKRVKHNDKLVLGHPNNQRRTK